jgi:hypothetical protein
VPGQLRHITEDTPEESIGDEVFDNELDMLVNDTNEDALLYFERLTKHYLWVVKNNLSPTTINRHDMKFPVIADSGANFHMFRDKEFLPLSHLLLEM